MVFRSAASFLGSLLRLALYALGALLVLDGFWMLFSSQDVAAWVPAGVAVAGFALVLGLIMIGLSDRARID